MLLLDIKYTNDSVIVKFQFGNLDGLSLIELSKCGFRVISSSNIPHMSLAERLMLENFLEKSLKLKDVCLLPK